MVKQTIRSYARWLPALIVAMTLVAILIGGFVLHYVETSMVASTGESLTLAAVDIADKLDMQMVERYGDIQLLARSSVFQGQDHEAMRERLLALLETYPVYRWAGVTDAKGLVLAATDGTSKGHDLSWEPGFLAVKAGHRAVIQDATPDDEGVLAVTFVSPLYNARGAFLGSVISQVGLPVLEDAFERSVSALQAQWGTGARIEYLFLDHDGNVFVDSMLREEGTVNLKEMGLPSARLIESAPAGFIEERHTRRHVDVVTGYAQTKGTEGLNSLKWGVLVRVDRSDILAPIRAIIWKVGAAGLTMMLPLVAILMWSITRLTDSWGAADEERNRAQAAEQKFYTLLEMAPDAIVMTDAAGTIVLTNRQADRIFAYPPGQLLGQSIEILVPESVRDRHRTHRASYHESPQARPMGTSLTLTGRRQDGSLFPIHTSLSHAVTAEGSFAMAAVRDVSQQQAEQAERERLSQEIRLLLDTTVGGLCGVDLQGRCTFINRAGAELLGYQPEELLGRDLHALTHYSHEDGSPYPGGECPIYCATQAGEGCQVDDEVLWRRNGSSFPVEIASRPLYEAGLLKGAVISFTNITERKQADEDLQKFQDQIRQMQKMEAIGQLAGGVAHDFNNILTAILGNAEMARAKLAADHPSRVNLTRILEAGDRASRLVQQILAFSHQQTLSRTALSLAPVVHEVLALLRATLPAGIELTASADAATPHVLADATQIHQVVMNLCTNAWHALGDESGSITVELAPVTLTQPLPGLQMTLPPGLYARLSIHDTGCGMDADTVARAFDPFFTTKPVGQGTGLGLSVVHGIILGHDGGIVVDSQPGQGTTFHLYFPATEAPAHASELAPATPVTKQERNHRVLYLDDEEMLVELVRAKLEPLGYHVTCCSRPEEALEAVRADPYGFDMLVTDYNLPGLSGLEVAQAIGHLRADLPVVLVSGYLSPAADAAIHAAGITEIIYKPDMLNQLGDVVSRLLNSAHRA